MLFCHPERSEGSSARDNSPPEKFDTYVVEDLSLSLKMTKGNELCDLCPQESLEWLNISQPNLIEIGKR